MQIQPDCPSVAPRSAAAPSADEATDNFILGRYRLMTRLALGGTAEVWRASDELLGRDVAVKLLHAHLVSDERARERLAAEACSVGALSHPAITRIYDLDLGSERPALVLQLVEGRSLAQRLDEGPLPPRRAAVIGAQVAAALAHAHEHGVVHRDVKPGNILIDPLGHAHLVDFGIAQALAGAEQHLTSTGTIAGTLPYMAPEQLSDGPIGPWTDLYGLGVVLHQALTGRLPFGPAAPVALARQQSAGPPRMRGVAPALAGVVRSCLARRPADRPRSAALVAAALQAWLAGESKPALALAPFPTGNVVRFGTAARQWSGAPQHRRSVVAALAASAAAGILAFAMATGESTPVAAPPLATPHVEGGLVPTPVVVGEPGGGVIAPPDSPVSADPPWLATMVAEYRDGCGDAADPLDLTGLSRTEASDLVASRVDACDAPNAAATSQPASRADHGKGRDNDKASRRDRSRGHDKDRPPGHDRGDRHHGHGDRGHGHDKPANQESEPLSEQS